MELRQRCRFGAGRRKLARAARNKFLPPAASRRTWLATATEPRNAVAESEAGDV